MSFSLSIRRAREEQVRAAMPHLSEKTILQIDDAGLVELAKLNKPSAKFAEGVSPRNSRRLNKKKRRKA